MAEFTGAAGSDTEGVPPRPDFGSPEVIDATTDALLASVLHALGPDCAPRREEFREDLRALQVESPFLSGFDMATLLQERNGWPFSQRLVAALDKSFLVADHCLDLALTAWTRDNDIRPEVPLHGYVELVGPRASNKAPVIGRVVAVHAEIGIYKVRFERELRVRGFDGVLAMTVPFEFTKRIHRPDNVHIPACEVGYEHTLSRDPVPEDEMSMDM